jgi:hypothetical protein
MAHAVDVEVAGAADDGDRPSRAWGDVPWQIWVVVAILALEGVGNFFSMFDHLAAAWWLFGKIVIITGLLKGWQWMFWIFLAIAAIHVIGFLEVMPVASLLNLLLMVLVISARRYFFGRANVSVSALE